MALWTTGENRESHQNTCWNHLPWQPAFLIILSLFFFLLKIQPCPAFSWMCYETLFSSLKCNADDQLSGTVPPNQSSSLAGTMGLFSLCTHALGLFTSVLCLKILCPLLSRFKRKDEGVGCLLLYLIQWNRNSFIVHLPINQHCFRTVILFSKCILLTLQLKLITIMKLIMCDQNRNNLELSNHTVTLNVWSVVAPRSPRCWKTEQLLGNKEAAAASVAVWSAYWMTLLGISLRLWIWLRGIDRFLSRQMWFFVAPASAPVLAVSWRAAQGIELHLWDHPG